MNEQDRVYMEMALDLARKGAGLVSPNPMVGALIVRDGRIVGRGYHRYDLLKHAEVNALDEAGKLARGATLYCSLEPCCHHGRTPPCTDALIESGINRAVIAMSDPDPRVNGRGFALLREAGITVETGLCEAQAARVNEKYIKFITTGSPFIHAILFQDHSDDSSSISRTPVWKPSIEFSEMAAEFDVIVLGNDPGLNGAIARLFAERVRHRSVVFATPLDSGFDYATDDGATASARRFSTPDELKALIDSSPNAGATSVLVLPSLDVPGLLDVIRPVDKVTVITPAPGEAGPSGSQKAGAAIAVETIESQVLSESGHLEVTGYPARAAEEIDQA